MALADPSFDKPSRVDILFGCDLCPQLILLDKRRGKVHESEARDTVLGWAICGQYSPDPPKTVSTIATINTMAITQTTDAILSKFWEREETPFLSHVLTPEENTVVKHFDSHHVFIQSTDRCRVTSIGRLQQNSSPKVRVKRMVYPEERNLERLPGHHPGVHGFAARGASTQISTV